MASVLVINLKIKMKKNECRLEKNYKYSRKSEHCHTETKYFLPQEYLLLDVFFQCTKKTADNKNSPAENKGLDILVLPRIR